VYRVLNEEGNKTGVPIKASDVYNKPTLKYLQQKFQENETARQPHKARVKNAVDLAFLQNPKMTLESLAKHLEKNGIHPVIRENSEGLIYGVTYVDHQTKCVFNGSDLGKGYSAKGLQERCSQGNPMESGTIAQQKEVSRQNRKSQFVNTGQKHSAEDTSIAAIPKAAEDLLQPLESSAYLPHQLKKSKKKKRKRISL
jgi:hypothetical protein